MVMIPVWVTRILPVGPMDERDSSEIFLLSLPSPIVEWNHDFWTEQHNDFRRSPSGWERFWREILSCQQPSPSVIPSRRVQAERLNSVREVVVTVSRLFLPRLM